MQSWMTSITLAAILAPALATVVLAAVELSCPEPVRSFGASAGTPRPLQLVEDLVLPEVLRHFRQGAGQAHSIQYPATCAVGEPVEAPSLETDLRATPIGAKPFGIDLDDAFLP